MLKFETELFMNVVFSIAINKEKEAISVKIFCLRISIIIFNYIS